MKIIIKKVLIIATVLCMSAAFMSSCSKKSDMLTTAYDIPAEKIEFVDIFGIPHSEDNVIAIEKGKSFQTDLRIYPENASNVKITYTSQNPEICKVDKNGVITGVEWGTTVIRAVADSGNRVANVIVKVTSSTPLGVTLSKENMSLVTGEIGRLSAFVDASADADKNVSYHSSNENIVKVDVTGKVTAVAPGEATVTVKTVVGDKYDTCKVTVTDGELPIYLDLKDVDGIEMNISGVYVSSIREINISENLLVKEGIDRSKIVVKIQSSSGVAGFDNGILTFNKQGIVTLKAYLGDENSPELLYECKIALKSE